MGFLDSYKHLEKICSEVYGDNHGLSTYIEEMKSIPDGSFYVRSWDEDLKQLKHYRWVRNQIVHEPGCTEENMCEFGDARWLDDFYSRIMSGNDPLTLYRKAKRPRTVQSTKRTYTLHHKYTRQTVHHKKKSQVPVGCLAFFICALIIVVAVVVVLNII